MKFLFLAMQLDISSSTIKDTDSKRSGEMTTGIMTKCQKKAKERKEDMLDKILIDASRSSKGYTFHVA